MSTRNKHIQLIFRYTEELKFITIMKTKIATTLINID